MNMWSLGFMRVRIRVQTELLHWAWSSCHLPARERLQIHPPVRSRRQTHTFANIYRTNGTLPSFFLSLSHCSRPTNAADTTDLSLAGTPDSSEGPLGRTSSQSSWHTPNQNGSFMPWNGCLAALMLSLENAWLESGISTGEGLAVWVGLCVCVLS